MRNWPKNYKNRWTQLKYLYLYRHKASSIPNFKFTPILLVNQDSFITMPLAGHHPLPTTAAQRYPTL